MKKIAACILIMATAIASCGCFKRTARLPGRNKEDIIDRQLEQLIEAIEDEDEDAIMDMFSEDALDDIDDMDEFEDAIEELIETFPDWDGDYDGYEDMTVAEFAHHSMNDRSYYCYAPTFDFWADGEDYELTMVIVYRADKEDWVGLRVIQICHEDCSDYTTPGFYSRPGIDTEPGVYCWDTEIH